MKKVFKGVCLAVAAACMVSGCSGLGLTKKSNSGQKITAWIALNSNAKTQVSNLSETPLGKAWCKESGVDVEFVHAQDNDQFNLMLASNDLTDIIETNWTEFPGGPEAALKNNQIISLNDVIDQYAPNLKKFLEENPEIDKACKTDNGTYYMFPFVRNDEKLLISTGPIVRKDWIEELGLSMPETIEDWENMLKAFKTEKGAESPLTLSGSTPMMSVGLFSGAYGAPKAFFHNNGTVQYGPVTDGYKECLMTLNRWYGEGLLDRNFVGLDSKVMDTNILTGKSGATLGAVGGGIGKWMGSATEEGFTLTGAKYPALTKGGKSMFSALQNVVPGFGAAISSKCKDIESAAKFLDYCYSEEGHMLMNFGIEGESYEMVDGYPKYTELITKNSDGYTMANMLGIYTRTSGLGAFEQDVRYIEQYASLDVQQEALRNWSDTDAEAHILPAVTPSGEESQELSKIINDCNTFEEEMTIAFIMGKKSFDEWDSYIAQMKTLGIDRAIEIYQAAYDRYMKR